MQALAIHRAYFAVEEEVKDNSLSVCGHGQWKCGTNNTIHDTQHTAMWVRKAKVGIHETYVSYKTQFMETAYIYLRITASTAHRTTTVGFSPPTFSMLHIIVPLLS